MRGQIARIYKDIRELLGEIPDVRDAYFMLGKPHQMTKFHAGVGVEDATGNQTGAGARVGA
jgi:hypothetical protein